MTHHHHSPPALHHARASFYDGSRPADGHGHASARGWYCALPGRHLGERVRLYLPSRGSVVLPVRDVCGTGGRIDLPRATFARLLGRQAVRRGVVPVRWEFVGRRSRRG